jgi:hypothetical protein
MASTITRGVTDAPQQAVGRGTAGAAADDFGYAVKEAAAALGAAAGTAMAAPRVPLLPTPENLARLAAQLSDALGAVYAGAGLAVQPAVELGADRDGALQLRGDRVDLARVERALNADPALARQAGALRTLAGAARAGQFAEQAASAVAAARTPAEAEAAHRKFMYLMENAAATVTLSFDGAVRVQELPV